MILIIDNYDSFTYNLFQQVEYLGKAAKVFKHDKITIKDIKELNPEKIIISPGPKRPKDTGISKSVIKNFYKKVGILGVCLGHQAIGEVFGAKTVHAKRILHGKTSEVFHDEKGIFHGMKNPFTAARYHSLILNKVPKDFKLSAWTKQNEIMGIQHTKHPLYGIQFHPESFMTKEGDKLMKNFLYEI